jgi:hypothetical protein
MSTDIDNSPAETRTLFAARLALGLLQGLALYLLYRAADAHVWPATEPTSFAPQFLTALYVPLLISQAMGTMRLRTLLIWALVATIATCGLATYDRLRDPVSVITNNDDLLPMFSLFFFGFAGLFIAQSLIAGGDAQRRFVASYDAYFDAAWKLGVQMALSAVFVGVFWGVLWLGAELFNLIKLDFLHKLIEHDWFAIPATALATAASIHLTDVRARLVAGIRGVVLTLLGWLLPLMALIAAGFLAGLFFTGFAPLWQTKAATAGLLGASAMLVVLINAAYQNGEGESPRPVLLRYSELVASFTLVPLVLIAAYALVLRVSQYGWTVERIAALACIIAALCYAFGYAGAAILSLLGRQWMQTLEPVNIAASFVVIVLLLALFTPVADPMRLSVEDQITKLQAGKIAAANFDYDYLRREGGRFGKHALEKLAAAKDLEIRRRAKCELAANAPSPQLAAGPFHLTANLAVYPKGRVLPQSFVTQKWAMTKPEVYVPGCLTMAGLACDAVLTDLDGDGVDEIIVINGDGQLYWWGTVMKLGDDGKWSAVGTLPAPHCKGDLEALRNGTFKTVPPPSSKWNVLEVGGREIHLEPVKQVSTVSCPP